MRTLYTITRFELKSLLRSPLYWIGWCLTIGWAVLWDSPLRDGTLWTDRQCAYRFGHGVVTLGCFILAIIFANSFRQERITKSPMVLFTQPINKFHYTLGKFLGIFLGTLAPILVGMICYLFIPLAFSEGLYSPKYFLEVLALYIIPSIFFYSSICYLVVILLKEFLFAAILPVVYLLTSETTLPWQTSIRIPGHMLTPLTYGMADAQTTALVYGDVLLNRMVILGLGVVLLGIAVASYSHKKYL